MNGYTGLDPAKVQSQIEEFFSKGMSFCVALSTNTSTYYKILEKIWCSPNAVQFSKKIFPELENCQIDVSNYYWKIAAAATKAYNTIAAANGLDTISGVVDEGAEAHVTDAKYVLKDVSESGIVGMNKEQVKEVTDGFVHYLDTDLITILEETPLDIAFYDPDNSLKTEYRNSIIKLIELVKEVINDISSETSAYVEKEVDAVELSAKKSVETLKVTA